MNSVSRLRSNSSIDLHFLLFNIVLFTLCIFLTWGPFFKWNNIVYPEIKFPYYYLLKVFPGLDNIRAPGRFGMFISLPLSIFIVALVQIIFTSTKLKNLIVITLLVAVIIESLPSYDIYQLSTDPQGVYQKIAEIDLSEAPLIELPVKTEAHFATLHNILDQLVGSTYHWNKLFVGYGSKFPDEYYNFLRIDKQIQDYETTPRRMFNFGIRYGVTNYLIHLDEYDQEIADEWLKMFQNNNACILLETQGTFLFSVDPLLCDRSMDS